MKRAVIAFFAGIFFVAAAAHGASFNLGTTNILIGPAAGSSSVVLAVSPPTAPWTASTNAAWLHLDASYSSGMGSTNIVFSFDANSGSTRSGTLTIGGQTLTVTQAGSTYITAQTMNTLVSGLNQPRGVALDNAGNVFIADTGDNAVKEWSRATHTVVPLVSSALSGPNAVAVDTNGNVYIADTGNNAVKEWVATSGNVTNLVSSGLYSPSGVALDPLGNVYIADGHDEVIFEWLVSSGTVTNLNIPNPNSICGGPGVGLDIAGNVYFDDTCEDGLLEWTANNSNTVSLQCCWLYNPTGVAVDGKGCVYIADQADNWIWQWSPANNNNTMGTPVSGLNRPGGVAVDEGGNNIYVADTANNAIEEWSQIYMDPTPKQEGLDAGQDTLPAILPVEATQLANFTPSSNQPWLTITGVTNGVVYFAFTATTSTRTATITMFGQNFPVTQRAPSVSLGLNIITVGSGAGSNSVILAEYPNTNTWTATANAAWLHLNQTGIGSTNIFFGIDTNPGPTRTGTLTIADQTLTVTQAGSTYVPVQSPTTLVAGTPYADGDAVDGAGNVFFTVADANSIRRWNITNNTVSTVVSSGLMYPTGVAADTAGDAYFNGNGTEKWTASNGGVSQLTTSGGQQPAVDAAGNVYFCSGNAIQVWTPANNTVSTVVPGGLSGAYGVAVDVAGDLYVDDNAGIQEWNAANNTVTLLAPIPTGTWVNECVAADGQGNVYMAGQNLYYDDSLVYKWSAVSNALVPLASSGQAEYFGVTVDSAGNVYFTDSYDGTLQELPNAYVDPTPITNGLAAGSGALPPVLPTTINLRAPFSPTSDVPWLTITGTNNGVVSYSYAQNVGLKRVGHIKLFGYSIPVTQFGPVFTLGTTALWEGAGAGLDSVSVGVSPNIGVWTATNNVSWLHLSTTNGTGGTNVVFSFDANPGGPRSGTLTISGQTVTVTQAGSTYVAANPVIPLISAGLSQPDGIAVDHTGNVYIADSANQVVKLWTPTNDAVTTLISAGLGRPAGLAVDAAGNLYIADTNNNVVFEWVAATSNLTTVVSTGLNGPTGVAVDGAGNVYIADTGNNAVKEWVAASNSVNTLVSSGLNHPAGVAVDDAGNVYIADQGNNVIKKWAAADGSITSLVSGLNQPSAVAVDGSGSVYIADTGNNAVEKWIAASNSVVTVASGLNSPAGVAIDGTENIYIADTGNNAVEEVPHTFVDSTPRQETADAGSGNLPVVLPVTQNLLTPFNPTTDESWLAVTGVTNGVVSFSFAADSGANRTGHILLLGQSIPVMQGGLTYTLGTSGELVLPVSWVSSVILAVAPKNAAWTATANVSWLHLDAANQSGTGSTNIIFTYDANPGPTRSGTLTIGGQTLTVTQPSAPYLSAKAVGTLVSSGIIFPTGVAVDNAGNVYIADFGNTAIKEWVAASNSVVTLVSSGLSNPRAVAVDGAGNVYIADTTHNAIKEWIATNKTVVTLVSSGLNNPRGLALDLAGNVYIVDSGNNAIKEWEPANSALVTLISSGLNNPGGVAVDVAGNVYIADSGNNAIKEWLAADHSVITITSVGLSNPNSVAVDGEGNVYFTDTGHNSIKMWIATKSLVSSQIFTGLSNPYGLALDQQGDLYIADSSHNAIDEQPFAFVAPTNIMEGLTAGTDQLPQFLPTTINLGAAFKPTSDQPWLTILGTTNGVVSFAYTANSGPARTGNIQLLGRTNSIMQAVVGTPPNLTGIQLLPNGAIQFSFTNNPSASFTVLSTTNLSLPLTSWSVVGVATNVAGDTFQFTGQPTGTNQQFYYMVRSP